MKKIASIDIFRIAAAFLVVAIHTSPLASFNETADFVLTRVIARVAVPFFFMVSGYFLSEKRILSFCKNTGLIYAGAIVLYLPLNIYNSYFSKDNLPVSLIKDILIDGTFYHLWYLPAAITGVLIVFGFGKKLKSGVVFGIAVVLYLFALGGDSYYGLVSGNETLSLIYSKLFLISDYTRNGFLYAPVFVALGRLMKNCRIKSMALNSIGFAISMGLMTAEALWLKWAGWQRHDSMYVMLPICMFFLFGLLLSANKGRNNDLSRVSLWIYIIHPLVIVVIRAAARPLGKWELLVENSLVHYIAVCIVSVLLAIIPVLLKRRIKPDENRAVLRAWSEIDLGAIRQNAKSFTGVLPEGCKLMAVIKADAYGHGAVQVAKTLENSGVRNFAVATFEEGIELRKNNIKGEILIFGYTEPADYRLLLRYKLTQSVVDINHGRELNALGKNLPVHVSVDTGMHRLGVQGLDDLVEIYSMNSLEKKGIYSHLSMSDMRTSEAEEHTKMQISCFDNMVAELEKLGIDTGKKHIQATYGVLNWPGLSYDFARIGIGLYGVLSSAEPVNTELPLRPALELKARVMSVRRVQAGEYICYGDSFMAEHDMTVAAVGIGYADGIPRAACENGMQVSVKGCMADVVGKICMDQLIVDVSGIEGVSPGDTVTIIGRDGDNIISCEAFAGTCSTITNDILSRIGKRPVRKYIGSTKGVHYRE